MYLLNCRNESQKCRNMSFFASSYFCIPYSFYFTTACYLAEKIIVTTSLPVWRTDNVKHCTFCMYVYG